MKLISETGTMRRLRERVMRAVFFSAASVSVIALCLIVLFIFSNGAPALREVGLADFILGRTWKPSAELYGILPMILGSVYVTAGALAIGVPLGIFTAVFTARYCPKRLLPCFKSAVSLLAGIPSVVYGYFGLAVIVPLVRRALGGSGKGVLSCSILLGIMILPTIIKLSCAALEALPRFYYEGALALGATRERSVFSVELPAAAKGILSSVILGCGRAVGETMAVVMVAGNQAVIPSHITSGVRTLTANVVLEMGYATELHRSALIATACVLFVFVAAINIIFSAVEGKG